MRAGAVFPGFPLTAAGSSQGEEFCKHSIGALQTAVCHGCPEIPLPHLGMKSSQAFLSAHPLPAQSHVTPAHGVTKCFHNLFETGKHLRNILVADEQFLQN